MNLVQQVTFRFQGNPAKDKQNKYNHKNGADISSLKQIKLKYAHG